MYRNDICPFNRGDRLICRSDFRRVGSGGCVLYSGSYSDYVTSNLMKCNTILAILIGLAAAGVLGPDKRICNIEDESGAFYRDTGDDDVRKRSHISVYRRISDQFQAASG